MPCYEIVAHLAVELDDTTPESAAAAFKRDLLARAGGAVTLHGLAVWRPSSGPGAATLPPPVQRHLTDFFTGVAGCAATAEAAFRVRVEEIFADTAPDATADVLGQHLSAVAVEIAGSDHRAAACWEGEGGAMARGNDGRREQG